MQKILGIFLFATFAGISSAHEANNFTCGNDGQIFNLTINPENNAVEKIMFFDNEYSWTPIDARVLDLSYSVKMQGHSQQINGSCHEAVFQFKLPPQRAVKQIQVGGYYVPVLRTIPFTFSLGLKVIEGTDATPYLLECSGM